MPSEDAIERARQRRSDQAGQRALEIQWFVREVTATVVLPIPKRVRLATELVRAKVVRNISRPVTKTVSFSYVISVNPQTGKKSRKRVSHTVVSNRSKPGEFPKADTTLLMKTIFGDVVQVDQYSWHGVIGTPLDYGVSLELLMDRSYLVRTLYEEYSNVMAILSGPIQ